MISRIVKYDKDLSFKDFAGLIGHQRRPTDIDEIQQIYFKNIGKLPKLSEKIDFDTVCLLMDDISKLLFPGPLVITMVLTRGKLRSSKTLKEISIGDKIAINLYPFDHYNRTLECVSKMCSDDLSGSDFKLFQMNDPDIIFLIEDDYEIFKYHGGYYHLKNPLWYIRLLNHEELNEDFLKKLEKEMDKWDKYNKLIKHIVAHRNEYISAKNGKKSNINGIVTNLKNGKTHADESDQLCDKCGKHLLSIYYRTPGVNHSRYYELICPYCNIDYGIDPTKEIESVVI